jgi:putative SOS response-associated peptidase YedK
MIATRFFEHVKKHKLEQRELRPGEQEEDVVLEFKPSNGQVMLVACLWSHWTRPGEPDLVSCAAITDDPPPEVAAAGHDRCVIPIKPERLDEWLSPSRDALKRSYDILDDRERPYYEHRLAA